MLRAKKFNDDRFTATQFDTVQVKARILNMLIRFVCEGFPEDKFTPELYNKLSLHFGHIAHYNRGGFYDAQFSTNERRLAFLEDHQSRHLGCQGQPEFTWCDVCREFSSWLATNHVLEYYRDAYSIKAPVIMYKQFAIAAISKNTGDFGHNQFLVVAEDGETWKLHHIQSNGHWKENQILTTQTRDGNPTWVGLSVEMPRKMQPPTKPEHWELVRNVWDKARKEGKLQPA